MGMIFYPAFAGSVTIEDGSITNTTLATDAVDANAVADDAVAEIQDGLATHQDALDILDEIVGLSGGIGAMRRSTQSDSTLMDGSELTLYEITPNAEAFFGEMHIFLPTSASSVVNLRCYIDPDGGGYRQLNGQTFNLTSGYRIVVGGNAANASGVGEDYPLYRMGMVQTIYYGFKITMEQTTEGAGYVTADYEVFDTVGS